MKTPLKLPAVLLNATTLTLFKLKDDKIYVIGECLHEIYIGRIYKYTRKGFYYIDLFGNKSYITWASLLDVSKQQDDDNLPNQLPLFPDTEEI